MRGATSYRYPGGLEWVIPALFAYLCNASTTSVTGLTSNRRSIRGIEEWSSVSLRREWDTKTSGGGDTPMGRTWSSQAERNVQVSAYVVEAKQLTSQACAAVWKALTMISFSAVKRAFAETLALLPRLLSLWTTQVFETQFTVTVILESPYVRMGHNVSRCSWLQHFLR